MLSGEKKRRVQALLAVPEDFVFWNTGGHCEYCSFPVNPQKGWVRLGSGAWLGRRLLWSEVGLAHQDCAEHERHFRKQPALSEEEISA